MTYIEWVKKELGYEKNDIYRSDEEVREKTKKLLVGKKLWICRYNKNKDIFGDTLKGRLVPTEAIVEESNFYSGGPICFRLLKGMNTTNKVVPLIADREYWANDTIETCLQFFETEEECRVGYRKTLDKIWASQLDQLEKLKDKMRAQYDRETKFFDN